MTLHRSYSLFGKSHSEIILESEESKGATDNNLKDWFEVMKKKCAPTTDTKVFGVDLKALMARNKDPKQNPIPEFLRKAVAYLDCNGKHCYSILFTPL
jgi:hypothetical protein